MPPVRRKLPVPPRPPSPRIGPHRRTSPRLCAMPSHLHQDNAADATHEGAPQSARSPVQAVQRQVCRSVEPEPARAVLPPEGEADVVLFLRLQLCEGVRPAAPHGEQSRGRTAGESGAGGGDARQEAGKGL
uniref:(northern house mosquito) hypothetical protein n=1 Tax=Culex pipiens TaxID=7175 RepID=A0A8D8FJR2_CULPI